MLDSKYRRMAVCLIECICITFCNMGTKTTTVQTRGVLLEVKERAERNVQRAGYDSLQSFLRMMTARAAEGHVPVPMAREEGWLSAGHVAELLRDEHEFEQDEQQGKTKGYKTAKEMVKDLLLDGE